MNNPKKTKSVKEPVQVYLDQPDIGLLAQVAAESGLSKAEIMRRGLRRIADEILKTQAPGASLNILIGAMAYSGDLPRDLAENHDEYLYGSADDAE